MRANNTVNTNRNYLNAFQKVYLHESLSSLLLGLLKIISYALVLPPLISGYYYLKNKKIVTLQYSLDEKIDRMQALFANAIPQDDRQSKLIDYLIYKLINFEPQDDLEREKLRFERAFRQLSFDSQADFFKRAMKEKCIALALAWVPKDIQEIYFVSGPQNPIQYAKSNNHHLHLLLEQLPSWNHIKKIHLSLRGTAFFGPSADANVQSMTLYGGFHASEDPRLQFNVGGVTYNFSNDPFYLLKAIQALKLLIKANPELEWDIQFMDLGLEGKGVELKGARGNLQYASNIIDYFKA